LYHIQIHFKKPVDGARGSIEFDKSFDQLQCNILKPYNNCDPFYCEERHIHPLNVTRISICRTEKQSGELLSKKLKETGRNSNRFDFLLKYASQEGNIANTFMKKNNCPRSKRVFESFKLYVWFILIPVIATIITIFINYLTFWSI
jgi:hypothetical protein